ncbi:MAG: nitroreductase [Nitrospirota bacterium]|nr:nitroreductase [Nitrospirota bacterium]
MNPVLQTIAERRSVRSYEPRPVPKDIILKIIEAGNQAPSAMNSQPWRFIVVEDKEFHKKLTETAIPKSKKRLEVLKEVNPERYQAIMKRYDELEDPIYYSAPVIIFVIGSGQFADLSCPLACENMMLAAFSLGLGSCWVHFGSLVMDNDEIKKEMELSPDEKIYGPIIIGYTEKFPETPPKKEPRIKYI